MDWMWQNAEKIGNLAQVLILVVAVIAVAFAYVQIRAATASQREATAKSLYNDYLTLAFQHPQYATPSQALITDDKYRWFVAILLNSSDEILKVGGHKIWEDIIATDLKYHKSYLTSSAFETDQGWNLYSPTLRQIFDSRVLNQSDRTSDA